MFQEANAKWNSLLGIFVPLLSGLLVAIAGAAYTFSCPKLYESQAKIWIHPKSTTESSRMVFSPMGSFFSSPLLTVCEILKSEAVLGRAKKLCKERGIEVSEDTFVFSKNYFVSSIKDSDILLVSYRSPDAKRSKEILQTVIDSFLALNASQTSGSASRTGEFLDMRAKECAEKAKAVRMKLKKFQDDHGTINVDQQVNALISQETRSNQNLEDNKLDISAMEATLDASRSQLHITEEQLNAAATLDQDDVMKGLRTELSQQTLDLTAMKTRLKDAHPRVKRAIRSLEKVQAEILKRAKDIAGEAGVQVVDSQLAFSDAQKAILNNILADESRLAGLKAKLAKNTSALDEIRARLKVVPNEQIEFAELNRQATAAEAEFQDLQKEKLKFNMAEFVTEHTANVEVVDKPSLPVEPASPVIPLYLASSLAAGLLVGAGLYFVFRLFGSPVIANLNDCSSIINYPILGWSSVTPAVSLSSLQTVVESMHRLRITWRLAGGGQRMIVVSSASRGDGEILAAAALAVSLAQSGSRVALLDTTVGVDEGVISKLFSLPAGIGLYDYLSTGEPSKMTSIIQAAPGHDNLVVIPAGMKVANARLESSHFEILCNKLKEETDFVVVATTALNKSLDALTLIKPDVNLLLTVRIGHSLKVALKLAASAL
ncbi:MAG: hypothetical protein K2X27_11690, partial [Candidatus Obscuribacterales bacterium]|nr:hypothetical protein [Candidatus Obscuribacterales bacterium]